MKVVDNRTRDPVMEFKDLRQGRVYQLVSQYTTLNNMTVLYTDEDKIVTLEESCLYNPGTLLNESHLYSEDEHVGFVEVLNPSLVLN